MPSEYSHPLSATVARAVSDMGALMRSEVRLARSELGEKVGMLANGGILIGAGAVLALGGLILFLFAIVQWLAIAGLPYEWGLLIVGVLVLVLGGLLVLSGARRMRGSSLIPHKTMHQLKADLKVVKEQLK